MKQAENRLAELNAKYRIKLCSKAELLCTQNPAEAGKPNFWRGLSAKEFMDLSRKIDGWVVYPNPGQGREFEPDLSLILKLCGSIHYEWLCQNQTFYIRRID